MCMLACVWKIKYAVACKRTETRGRCMQVTGRTRIGGTAIAPVADTIRGGADDDWGEILLDDEVVADKPSGASGKGGAPLPVIENEPADVAKTKAKGDRTLQMLYSGKHKVKSALECATTMGGAKGLRGREPGWCHGHHRGLHILSGEDGQA